MSLTIDSAVQRSHDSVRTGLWAINEWQSYASYFLRLREATKESVVRGREQWVNWNSQSMSVSRMAMANDSTNFIKSSAVSDIFTVLFTFLTRFRSVIAKVIPIVKWSSFALHACSSPFVEYFASSTPSFRLIRAVRSSYRGSRWIFVKTACA